MWIFKKETPPAPKPFYKKQPLATAALLFTIVATLILGPVGYLWNGMAEELKKKVDNKTLQLMIEADRTALQLQAEGLKERISKDEKQDKAILENQKTLIIYQQSITSPKSKITLDAIKPVPPEFFTQYLKLNDKMKAEYKKYLKSVGYDVDGL